MYVYIFILYTYVQYIQSDVLIDVQKIIITIVSYIFGRQYVVLLLHYVLSGADTYLQYNIQYNLAYLINLFVSYAYTIV